MAYRSHPLRRIRAFLLTDRVGHTIASTIGITKILLWWTRRSLGRLAGGILGNRSGRAN
ncbi:MAG TPA: hypothetical protein VGO97_00340 [Solirubrobacterales bacterium]|nr:hypothetical protein [Solirubrobacterales bacterium]